MSYRRNAGMLVLATLLGAAGGCSSRASQAPATPASITRDIAAVSSSATSNPAQAGAALSSLEADVKTQTAAGTLNASRGAALIAAAEHVRADLSVPTAAPVAPSSTAPGRVMPPPAPTLAPSLGDPGHSKGKGHRKGDENGGGND